MPDIDLRSTFQDKTYSTTARVPPIFEQGLQLFVDRIIRSPVYPIRGHLINTLLAQIQVERDGYTINRSAVKGCVEVLMELQDLKETATIYKKDFEPVFLRESELFYQNEGERLIQSCDAPEYLRRVSGPMGMLIEDDDSP